MAMFVRIVEHNSISAAARAMGLQKSTLSRRLCALEAHLGTPLVRRSSRSLTLTDAGQRYYQRAAPLVAEAAIAEEEARASHGVPAGLLRITAPVGFGQSVLTPLLCEFLQAHSQVRLDLRFTDRRVNLIEAGFDVAVRMGPLEESDLIARRLCSVRRVLCATPAYLADHGSPATLAQVREHACVVIRPELTDWHFQTATGRKEVRIRWRLAAGNTEAARTAVLATLGIANLPHFSVASDLASGALVSLLDESPPTPEDATALTPPSRTPSLAARAVVDWLASRLYGKVL